MIYRRSPRRPTTVDHQRHLDRLAVIERCEDGTAAQARYRSLHQNESLREFYYVHTSRVKLNIREQQWLGVRENFDSAQ
jgi:hypothetical protein